MTAPRRAAPAATRLPVAAIAATRAPDPGQTAPAAGSVYTGGQHVRATLVLLAVAVLLLGVAYPLALVGFGQLVNPQGANGSLNHNPNGTVSNSSLAPNVTSTVGGPVVPLPAVPPSSIAPRLAGETILYAAPRGGR